MGRITHPPQLGGLDRWDGVGTSASLKVDVSPAIAEVLLQLRRPVQAGPASDASDERDGDSRVWPGADWIRFLIGATPSNPLAS